MECFVIFCKSAASKLLPLGELIVEKRKPSEVLPSIGRIIVVLVQLDILRGCTLVAVRPVRPSKGSPPWRGSPAQASAALAQSGEGSSEREQEKKERKKEKRKTKKTNYKKLFILASVIYCIMVDIHVSNFWLN